MPKFSLKKLQSQSVQNTLYVAEHYCAADPQLDLTDAVFAARADNPGAPAGAAWAIIRALNRYPEIQDRVELLEAAAHIVATDGL